MSGDISLSNALGGLRIANPDNEEAILSPVSSESPVDEQPTILPPLNQAHPSTGTSANSTSSGLLPNFSHEAAELPGGGIGFNPESYSIQNGSNSPAISQISHHSRSPTTPGAEFPRQHQLPLSHRQSLPLNDPQQQVMQFPTATTPYGQQFRTASGQSAATQPTGGMYQFPNTSNSSTGSYRYREEMVAAVEPSYYDVSRSGSRGANSAAGTPVRGGNQPYRSSSRQTSGGNGPLPPRRNSLRARAATNGSASGYETAAAAAATAYGASAPLPTSSEEWRERGAAVSVRQETDSSGQVQTKVTKKGVKDFSFGRTLGEGSYSTVLAAQDRQNSKEYAIKVLDKRHIIKEKKVKYVNIERDTLNRLTEHPGIVRLYYTFQDERSLYFVLDLATGGELLGVLKKTGSFDVECTRFYGAQILDSIAYMHTRGVIHRDLKPENVLLDRDGHTKITDFGTAKILPDPKRGESIESGFAPGDPTDGAELDRANSFVGTAEYVSPELLQRSSACKASDLWAFGCIIYQLLAGRPPFKAANEYLTFQKILGLEYTFPDGFPPAARDLVERLLVLDPANRLPVEHIKNHEFFEGVQWGKSLWRQKAPRLKPFVPPPAEPIKLNGASTSNGFSAAAPNPVVSPQPPRPHLRGITDLPPPSQLDIEWSPVLTNNERILKLGNLVVTASPHPESRTGDPSTPSEKTKIRSFFSNATKKRERLVLITSNARLVIAATGGNDKKAKMEINCLANGAGWRDYIDAKGLTAFQLDTREKHITFEDPRATTSDPAGSKYSTQEWLNALDSAREIALAQSLASSYSGDSLLNAVESSGESPADSLGADAVMPLSGPSAGDRRMRQTLRRNTDDNGENGGSRRRFSKRHSKSGLAAVF